MGTEELKVDAREVTNSGHEHKIKCEQCSYWSYDCAQCVRNFYTSVIAADYTTKHTYDSLNRSFHHLMRRNHVLSEDVDSLVTLCEEYSAKIKKLEADLAWALRN